MIYQWYSGSDTTKKVPSLIRAFDIGFSDRTGPENINYLIGVLDFEDDQNWRGYLLSRIGSLHECDRNYPEAIRYYSLALDSFEPFSANFLDVVDQYCRTLDGLICRKHSIEDDPEGLSVAGFSALAFLDISEFSPTDSITIFAWLARALRSLGDRTNEAVFYRLALPIALRAHHLEPECPGSLRELIFCYFHLRDPRRCSQVFHAFLEVAEPGETREQVIRFMMERFHEIGDPKQFDLRSWNQ